MLSGSDSICFRLFFLHRKSWYPFENQFSSVAQSCPTLCNPMDCSMPGFPVLCQLLELTQTHVHDELVMSSNHLILCHSLLLLSSIFPSIRVFSSELVLYIRWPKYWSFSFSMSPSSEYLGLSSFVIDWVQSKGLPKSLLQHHSSKASVLPWSAFFIVQFSHPYMTTGKTRALTIDFCWQSNDSAFQYSV